MGQPNEALGRDDRPVTLQQAVKRIEQLERMVEWCMHAIRTHHHEYEVTGESSCGCCSGPTATYTTNEAAGLPGLPE